jgi:hypothetical protein
MTPRGYCAKSPTERHYWLLPDVATEGGESPMFRATCLHCQEIKENRPFDIKDRYVEVKAPRIMTVYPIESRTKRRG